MSGNVVHLLSGESRSSANVSLQQPLQIAQPMLPPPAEPIAEPEPVPVTAAAASEQLTAPIPWTVHFEPEPSTRPPLRPTLPNPNVGLTTGRPVAHPTSASSWRYVRRLDHGVTHEWDRLIWACYATIFVLGIAIGWLLRSVV